MEPLCCCGSAVTTSTFRGGRNGANSAPAPASAPSRSLRALPFVRDTGKELGKQLRTRGSSLPRGWVWGGCGCARGFGSRELPLWSVPGSGQAQNFPCLKLVLGIEEDKNLLSLSPVLRGETPE